MRRTIATLLLMAGALAPAIGASAQQDAGGVGIRLLEAPTERQNDPRALRSVVDHVKPGSSFSRKFEVKNTTDARRLIQIYAAAADVQGGTFVTADGRTQNELSSWISIDVSSADLGPDQAVQPRLKVTVPKDATAGERYAVVWAELPPAAPPGGGVAVVNRVGLRVYLSVGPGGEPPTDFVVESLTAERDEQRRPVVVASVRNTGGRALDLTGTLRLSDGPGDLTAGPFDVNVGTTLAIGATAPVTVQLDSALPDGPWHAVLEMRSSNTIRKAEATITFPSAAGATAPPVQAHSLDKKTGAITDAVPLLAGLVVILLLGLLLALLLRRRGRHKETAPRPAPAPPLAPVAPPSIDEVLGELATATGDRREELMGLAVDHGRDAIMASPRLPGLPVDTARELGARVAKSGR